MPRQLYSLYSKYSINEFINRLFVSQVREAGVVSVRGKPQRLYANLLGQFDQIVGQKHRKLVSGQRT
jgi:hypothetical protein